MEKALKTEKAYDLSRFDRRYSVREQVAKEKEASKASTKDKAKAKSTVSASTVFTWVLCIAILVMTVCSYMQLNETADEANKLERELAALREENQLLEIEKSQKYGSEQLQKIAVEELGMQKIVKSQITYIKTESGDHTEVAQSDTMRKKDSKLLAGIASGFDRFVEYIN